MTVRRSSGSTSSWLLHPRSPQMGARRAPCARTASRTSRTATFYWCWCGALAAGLQTALRMHPVLETLTPRLGWLEVCARGPALAPSLARGRCLGWLGVSCPHALAEGVSREQG
jgi:hypothetical protein